MGVAVADLDRMLAQETAARVDIRDGTHDRLDAAVGVVGAGAGHRQQQSQFIGIGRRAREPGYHCKDARRRRGHDEFAAVHVFQDLGPFMIADVWSFLGHDLLLPFG